MPLLFVCLFWVVNVKEWHCFSVWVYVNHIRKTISCLDLGKNEQCHSCLFVRIISIMEVSRMKIARRKPLNANVGVLGVGHHTYWEQFERYVDVISEDMARVEYGDVVNGA